MLTKKPRKNDILRYKEDVYYRVMGAFKNYDSIINIQPYDIINKKDMAGDHTQIITYFVDNGKIVYNELLEEL